MVYSDKKVTFVTLGDKRCTFEHFSLKGKNVKIQNNRVLFFRKVLDSPKMFTLTFKLSEKNKIIIQLGSFAIKRML